MDLRRPTSGPPVLILSSLVAADAVGGGAAQAFLRREGHDAALVPSVVFGRHPGRGAAGGGRVPDGVFEGAIEGFLSRHPAPAAILTGYFATPAQAAAAAKAIDAARKADPDLLVLVDPVIGDGEDGSGKLYVPEAVARAVRDQLAPRAGALTPNAFELAWLAERPIESLEDAVEAAAALSTPAIFVTSAPTSDPERIASLLVESGDARVIEATRRPDAPRGTGDLFAAAALSAWLDGAPPRGMLARAEAFARAAVETAWAANADDLAPAKAAPLLTPRRLGAQGPAWVLGLDGAAGGWAGVMIDLNGVEPPRSAVYPDFQAALDAPEGFKVIAVDMPVGFPAQPGEDGRVCERLARERLGPRRASVFASPLRPALEARSYKAANAANRAAGGPGLSKQAFNLFPKIREIDAAMTPALEGCVHEVHPELAFATLSGAPMAHAKRTAPGRAERLDVLAAAGLPADLFEPHPYPKSSAAPDDLVDAGVLALSAMRIAEGEALCLPEDPPRDERGLRMAIFA